MANWEPTDLLRAATRVEFENTNYLGTGKKYSRLPVPKGGHMFRAYDLNHSYEDCDVFVSIAKMKDDPEKASQDGPLAAPPGMPIGSDEMNYCKFGY